MAGTATNAASSAPAREQTDERSSGYGYESSAFGSKRGTSRWREPGSTGRDRMEEQYGGGSQGDY
jgi:hypothetical protein